MPQGNAITKTDRLAQLITSVILGIFHCGGDIYYCLLELVNLVVRLIKRGLYCLADLCAADSVPGM